MEDNFEEKLVLELKRYVTENLPLNSMSDEELEEGLKRIERFIKTLNK